MKHLLYKELRLALHPTAPLFLCLSAMLLIPNYPYYVIFFYTCLGVFFLCLNGRETQDLFYSMLLPVRKRQIVQARISLVVLIELAQVLLAIPFAVLRSVLIPLHNEAGIEANTAFFGLGLLLLGVFNFFFFTRYYRNPDKVGGPFCAGCIAFAVCMLLAETAVHVLPFAREQLDTIDPANLPAQLLVLAAGIVLFGLLTGSACRKSVRSFEQLDL